MNALVIKIQSIHFPFFIFHFSFFLMDLLSIIIISIGLAMDCFAVSISKGIIVKKFFWGFTLRMAILFGLFQALMPLIGFMLGKSFAKDISTYDHWVAFILLFLIGTKMIVEGLQSHNPENQKELNPFSWKLLLSLALATSIDALATGIVFVPFPHLILIAITIIGITSFTFSAFGMYIGVHFGKKFNLKVEALGGGILIAIGLKILLEHLYA